jgi:transposase
MTPYSMDLRTRVLQDSDGGLKAQAVAEKYRVSLAWVNRLLQRRRESGQIAPRKQTKFRPLLLAGQTEQLKTLIAEQPDRTLVELRAALQTPVGLATIWRAIDRLDLTVKKNRSRG